MPSLISRFATHFTMSLLVTLAIASHGFAAQATLIQKDLFFGRTTPGGERVSDEQFQAFLDTVITPRFPDGLTILNAKGEFSDPAILPIQASSTLVTLFTEDSAQSNTAVNEIVNQYLQQFKQESITQVINKDDLKVGFGANENLIDNDPIPELIRADLFFGRNIRGGGEVSDSQFQTFVDQEITPRFPDGLTILDGNGQFKDSTNTIIEEPSKIVTLILEDSVKNETAIDDIINAYIQQFNQESVLVAVNEDVAVGFGAGENLIENDPIPELIQTDLFFGRNIRGGGEVSESQFKTFVEREIVPRFVDGLTIFDALGQFKDSTGTIIEEPSKVVRLLLEDTTQNEDAIDEVIKAYTQQFNQESVLQVVDEDVEVTFNSQSPTEMVPEPMTAVGPLTIGIIVLFCRRTRQQQADDQIAHRVP